MHVFRHNKHYIYPHKFSAKDTNWNSKQKRPLPLLPFQTLKFGKRTYTLCEWVKWLHQNKIWAKWRPRTNGCSNTVTSSFWAERGAAAAPTTCLLLPFGRNPTAPSSPRFGSGAFASSWPTFKKSCSEPSSPFCSSPFLSPSLLSIAISGGLVLLSFLFCPSRS